MRTVTTRTIAGRVNADGTSASGGEFVSRKTATGQYAVTLSGLRLIGVAASPANFATGQVNSLTPPVTGQSFTFATSTANTGAAADSAFQFLATVAI